MGVSATKLTAAPSWQVAQGQRGSAVEQLSGPLVDQPGGKVPPPDLPAAYQLPAQTESTILFNLQKHLGLCSNSEYACLLCVLK